MTSSNDERTGVDNTDQEERPSEVLAALAGAAPDGAVVDWAADEAHRLGASLRLVHVIDPGVQLTPYPALMAGMRTVSDDLDREANQLVQAWAERARLRQPSLQVHTTVPWGPPGGALVDLSTEAVRLVIGGRARLIFDGSCWAR